MALMFFSEYDDPREWKEHLVALMPDLDVRIWPDLGRLEDIDCALVWKHKPGDLKRYPNLKMIVNLGAGVDYILTDPDLPRGVPIVRLVDPYLTKQMSDYIVLTVLAYHRRFPEFARAQRERRWQYIHPVDPARTRVGVMGLGVLGGDAARRLRELDFQVAGWSRTPKAIDGVASFHGADGLMPFLDRTDILVCLLPRTRDTDDLLDARTLRALPQGARVVNAGRGHLIVDGDLIAALDDGQIAHATLDVFRTEPLPADHPYWRHERVTITPHCASVTLPRTAAPQIIDNLRRLRDGRKLLNRVDPAAGY
jgi:glyoxylate/hydroxypyruvate reductase A